MLSGSEAAHPSLRSGFVRWTQTFKTNTGNCHKLGSNSSSLCPDYPASSNESPKSVLCIMMIVYWLLFLINAADLVSSLLEISSYHNRPRYDPCLPWLTESVTHIFRLRGVHVQLSLTVFFYFGAWWKLNYFAGDNIAKNEMGRACSAYGGGERCVQDCGGETWGKEATG
jgi:hypothetical protein